MEGVGPIQCPGFVSKALQVCSECTTEYIVGLYQITSVSCEGKGVEKCKMHHRFLTDSTLLVHLEKQWSQQVPVTIQHGNMDQGSH